MASDKHNPVAHKLLGRGHSLRSLAGIISDNELDDLSEHPARGVDIPNRHLGALLELLALPCVGSAQRPCNADQDVGPPGRSDDKGDDDACELSEQRTPHVALTPV